MSKVGCISGDFDGGQLHERDEVGIGMIPVTVRPGEEQALYRDTLEHLVEDVYLEVVYPKLKRVTFHLGWDNHAQKFCLWCGATLPEHPDAVLILDIRISKLHAKSILGCVSKVWDALYEREFPQHAKVQRIWEQVQACTAFVEFLQENKKVVFSHYHVHDPVGCYYLDGTLSCGLSEHELSELSASEEDYLIYEYFGVDIPLFKAEKQRILGAFRLRRRNDD